MQVAWSWTFVKSVIAGIRRGEVEYECKFMPLVVMHCHAYNIQYNAQCLTLSWTYSARLDSTPIDSHFSR